MIAARFYMTTASVSKQTALFAAQSRHDGATTVPTVSICTDASGVTTSSSGSTSNNIAVAA
jgi:hypothetical protein